MPREDTRCGSVSTYLSLSFASIRRERAAEATSPAGNQRKMHCDVKDSFSRPSSPRRAPSPFSPVAPHLVLFLRHPHRVERRRTFSLSMRARVPSTFLFLGEQIEETDRPWTGIRWKKRRRRRRKKKKLTRGVRNERTGGTDRESRRVYCVLRLGSVKRSCSEIYVAHRWDSDVNIDRYSIYF